MSKRSPRPFDTRLGRLVKMQRIAANLTQEELGKIIGVSFQQIQKYENGSNRITVSRIQTISAALGVHANFFFDEDNFTARAARNVEDSIPLDSTLFRTNDWRNLSSAFLSIQDPAMRGKISEIVIMLAKLESEKIAAIQASEVA